MNQEEQNNKMGEIGARCRVDECFKRFSYTACCNSTFYALQ